MKIFNDISKEELAVFLDETDEQLKILDEDLVLMEKSGVEKHVIQEIFRAAHTLKGSSAMLGYEKMSQVAHAMESILDLLRSGKLELTTAMINALFCGLDVLKVLRERLVSDDEQDEVDINEAMTILTEVVSTGRENTVANPIPSVATDQKSLDRMKTAREKGYHFFNILINLEKSSAWLSVRHFQLYTELGHIGEIMACSPSREEIEAGTTVAQMSVILASGKETGAIKTCLNSVQDVINIDIHSSRENSAAVKNNGNTAAVEATKTAKQSNNNQPARTNTRISDTVRVDIKLLDNLMNLVGEMVIDRNRIRQIGRMLEKKYRDDANIETLNVTGVHMGKLVSDLHENILRARMQGIGTILNGFPRLVRDLAQKAGKKIDLFIEGQETELDRSIIEQIRDPLLHLLRNSVDHGIEMPEKRRQAAKKETGTIRLAVYHEQSHVIVSISDDGAGIDPEKVKQAAVSKGFISADTAARLSPSEAQNLIFMNGVSTAAQVSEVSGRGVGMDVVKTNVSSVGGSISIDSQPGHGTTIKIRLPLTLATVDGILVSSGGLTYVVPMAAILEILKIKADQVYGVMGQEVIRLRENIIPLVRLNERFSDDGTSVAMAKELNVMVIKVGDKLSGLVVDTVLEPQESVVKPLGKFIGSLRGISGATIMGDGQVALILDTATLIKES